MERTVVSDIQRTRTSAVYSLSPFSMLMVDATSNSFWPFNQHWKGEGDRKWGNGKKSATDSLYFEKDCSLESEIFHKTLDAYNIIFYSGTPL